ncbi:sulfite exporter TauE/SafE family protein [Dyadobacter flavalbus]|uniref:Sulfite exporter TauE/SafE family protein n=2 Tax=Dyadobacter flavalbus TaxID=2579942 RepID=A0A5M8QXR6_9BACT|nr:sulfite exporter TauE/SafE family protein [Dyadobacter flavalbus]
MGLLSSFHCIGMCGPIALALPDQAGNRWRKVNGFLFYNLGRSLSYAALGAVVGLLGNAVAWMGYLSYLSVIAGIGMLGYVLWPKTFGLWLHPPEMWSAVITHLKKRMSVMLQSRKMHGRLFLGILNGLLPCGLVYLALASSAATGNVSGAAWYMFVFGTGTLPMMMAIGLFKNGFTPSLRSRFHRFTPVVIAIAGCWLVLRGVMIKYPQSGHTQAAQITICHGK